MARIDAAQACVWHYPRTLGEAQPRCENQRTYPSVGTEYWPVGGTWPDWFIFGDPHENFYEGSVLYDDVKLEVWRP